MSIPSLANQLIERSTVNNWVVVFKSLITTHHLMSYGNERFSAYLATSNANVFNVNNFLDKSSSLSIEMSSFVRRYSRYINCKATAYRSFGADFAKIRPKDNPLRNMSGDRLLKTLPVLQSLVDSLLEFDAHARDLKNGVMTAAFVLLYRDLIRLFAAFNDGIINLLEKFFSFKGKKEARAALDLYKKFLIRMDRVADFLKTAEAVGIDRGDIPDLTRAPSSLLDALEAHCLSLEGSSGSSQQKTSVVGGSSHAFDDESSAIKRALEEEAEFLSKIEQQKKQQQNKNGSSQQQQQQQQQLVSLSSPISTPLTDRVSQSSSTASAASSIDLIDPFFAPDDEKEKDNKKIAKDILALFENNSNNMFNNTMNVNTMMFPVHQSFGSGSPMHQSMHQPIQHPFNVQQQPSSSFGPPSSSSNPFLPNPSNQMMFPTTPSTGSFNQMRQTTQPPLTQQSSSSFEANFASAFPSNSSNNSNNTNQKSSTEAFLSQDFSLL